MKRFLVFLAAVFSFTSIAGAEVPRLINFQGRLNTPADTNVSDGVYTFRFRIYDDSTGFGSVLWEETGPVQVTEGIFNALLGSTIPVPDSVFNSPNRWLGIKVNFDPEMAPRQRLSSVGYSYVSSQWTSAAENLFKLSGNVGIGTVSPTEKFDVAASGNTAIRIRDTGTNQRGFLVFGDAAPGVFNIGLWRGTQNGLSAGNQLNLAGFDAINFMTGQQAFGSSPLRMTIDVNGSIGIGTTNVPTQYSKLTLKNNTAEPYISLLGRTGDDHSVIAAHSNDGSSTSWMQLFYNDKLQFQNSAQERVVTILQNGNVGIGTTSPAAKLHVTGTTTGGAAKIVTETGFETFTFNGFDSNGIRALRINTPNGGDWLDVAYHSSGGGDYPTAMRFHSDVGLGAAGNSTRFLFREIGDTSKLELRNNGGAYFGGNVGIGTTNPLNVLHVSSGSSDKGVLIDGGVGTHLSLLQGGFGPQISFDNTRNLDINSQPYADRGTLVNLTNLIRIQANGNVGIGTTNPTQKLEVADTIYSSVGGFKFPDGTVQTTAGGGGGLPAGMIVMWSGDTASIPSGWALCNGTNGTPDLRDRFIYGISAGENPGATGGVTTHSHTVNSHNHSVDPPFTITSMTSNTVGMTSGGVGIPGSTHTHSVDISSFNSGNSTPGTNMASNLPPYYKLAFIMKL